MILTTAHKEMIQNSSMHTVKNCTISKHTGKEALISRERGNLNSKVETEQKGKK